MKEEWIFHEGSICRGVGGQRGFGRGKARRRLAHLLDHDDFSDESGEGLVEPEL